MKATGFSTDRSPTDVLYFEGVGDVLGAFQAWRNGVEPDSQTSRTFSGQFFSFSRSKELRARVYGHNERQGSLNEGGFWVENRRSKWGEKGSQRRLGKFSRGLFILFAALRYRPRDLHVFSGVTYWWLLAPLRLYNIRIVAHMHNALWPQGYPPTHFKGRLALRLDSWFFRHIARAALCVSPTVEQQIRQICGSDVCLLRQFRAQFNPADFVNFPMPQREIKPFRVIFTGRVERTKGVFDLLSVAQSLRYEGVVFDICGEGRSLSELRREIEKLGLEDVVYVHGRLRRTELLEFYKKAHAVIIPTRSDFAEGLPLSSIEAVLVGRPQITSVLSNASDVFGAAILEAEPNQPETYAAAIRRLMSEPHIYQALVESCAGFSPIFLNGQCDLERALNGLD